MYLANNWVKFVGVRKLPNDTPISIKYLGSRTTSTFLVIPQISFSRTTYRVISCHIIYHVAPHRVVRVVWGQIVSYLKRCIWSCRFISLYCVTSHHVALHHIPDVRAPFDTTIYLHAQKIGFRFFFSLAALNVMDLPGTLDQLWSIWCQTLQT